MFKVCRLTTRICVFLARGHARLEGGLDGSGGILRMCFEPVLYIISLAEIVYPPLFRFICTLCFGAVILNSLVGL